MKLILFSEGILVSILFNLILQPGVFHLSSSLFSFTITAAETAGHCGGDSSLASSRAEGFGRVLFPKSDGGETVSPWGRCHGAAANGAQCAFTGT